MSVVSSCDGVMGVEERLSAESGYASRKIVGSRENVWLHWTQSPLRSPGCNADHVIILPGCSRKNRISEAGSVEEYTPLTWKSDNTAPSITS
jgi:hypothetical protein